MTVETVGLYKTADRNPEKLRPIPIGMRNPFIKTIHKETQVNVLQKRRTFARDHANF